MATQASGIMMSGSGKNSSLKLEKKDTVKLYNLPKKVRFCARCVVSNQRPRITFDEKGVCSACSYTEKKRKHINWDERERQLCELLDKYRRSDGSFDVIVPSSGGKDSAFVAHQLKYKYDMHPLTITWAPHIYTPIGWDNFQALIRSGLPNILGTADGIVHRKLARRCLIDMGEPFQPFIYGQVSFPLHMAVKYGIQLIMDGENGEVEYGGDDTTFERQGFSFEDEIKYWFSSFPVEKWLKDGFSKKDLYFYLPPPVDRVLSAGIDRRFFSYYKNWLPQEHYYYASEHTGFRANPDGRSEGTYSKYASLDDRIDGFHYYFMFLKFGISRATSDAAHEIRDGHLTREEAVRLVKKYDGEFPAKYFSEFLEYCELTEDDFWAIADSWRSSHLWENKDGKWQLKYQVE